MSLAYLLDTNTCVYWLRGRETVRQRLAAAGPATVGLAIVTLAELRYGADCSAHPAANHGAIDAFISGLTVVGLDDAESLKSPLGGLGLSHLTATLTAKTPEMRMLLLESLRSRAAAKP